jgi:hypothetical protein
VKSFLGRGAAVLGFAFAVLAPLPSSASLSHAQRTVLGSYLAALERARYDAAFSLLDAGERHYFGTAQNYASSYVADRFVLVSYRILGSESTSAGTVAIVSERVRFRDHARDATASATVEVPYGIVSAPHAAEAIHDPGHPWRAEATIGVTAESGGLRATVRKVSFFTGRVEFVVTFENRGAETVTLLPYGRSVLRDGAGTVYRPIATRASGLTDAELYIGLRLPRSARYTGFITFATPERFTPRSLQLTLAPALADGGSAPFELPFAPIAFAARVSSIIW